MEPLREPLLAEPQSPPRKIFLSAPVIHTEILSPKQPEDEGLSDGAFSVSSDSDEEPFVPPAQLMRVVSKLASTGYDHSRSPSDAGCFTPNARSSCNDDQGLLLDRMPTIPDELNGQPREEFSASVANPEPLLRDLRDLVANQMPKTRSRSNSSIVHRNLSRRSTGDRASRTSSMISHTGSANTGADRGPRFKSVTFTDEVIREEKSLISISGPEGAPDQSGTSTVNVDFCSHVVAPEHEPVPHTLQPTQPFCEDHTFLCLPTMTDALDDDNGLSSLTCITGTLYKRHAKLSKSAKVLRVLRQEARVVLDSGLAQIHLDRIGKLAKEIMGLHRTSQPASPAAVHAEADDDEEMWERHYFSLEERKSILAWSRGPAAGTDVGEGSPESNVAPQFHEIGCLWGSSVAHQGVKCQGRFHTFSVFLPPTVRRKKLNLAAETAEEAERWVNAIRRACAFPFHMPLQPLPRPLLSRIADFCMARGPPTGYEPPLSVLQIAFVGLFHMRRRGSTLSSGVGNSYSVYVLGRVRDCEFRTATRQSGNNVSNVPMDESFDIPLECDGADEAVVFNVYDEPEFEDNEPLLLGSISVPLFALGRNSPLDLVLPLKQASTTREGVVQASFGELHVSATLQQPLGHIWLPVEPPLLEDGSASDPDHPQQRTENIDFVDLEMQISRLDGLLTTWNEWITTLAFIIQWDRPWYSLAWFVFFEMWMLFFWRWSLSILISFLLKCTLELRTARKTDARNVPTSTRPSSRLSSRKLSSLPNKAVVEREPSDIMESVPSSIPAEAEQEQENIVVVDSGFSSTLSTVPAEASRRDSFDQEGGSFRPSIFGLDQEGRSRAPSRWATADDAEDGEENAKPDRVVWEVERRVVFFGFDATYLHEFDPPNWADPKGEARASPLLVEKEGDVCYRYRWKIVVNTETDENGWQYAWRFNSDEWRTTFDTTGTWVRRRQHHGFRVERLQQGDHQDVYVSYDSFPSFENENLETRTSTPGPGNVEQLLSDVNQFRRYFQLYHAIRHDVVDWFCRIEKHKNLFTWKDRDVTQEVAAALAALLAIAVVTPTRVIMALIIGITFYAGWLTGQMKRRHRATFLGDLSLWYSEVCHDEVHLKADDTCVSLEPRGITRLALRNWCNCKYKITLDLRTVDQCCLLGELADIVVRMSSMFEKIVRRYRAWHSDFYLNFLDHVPSDAADHDIASFWYHPAARTSLPPIPA